MQSINGLLLKGFIKVQEAFQGPAINGSVIVQTRRVWWREWMGAIWRSLPFARPELLAYRILNQNNKNHKTNSEKWTKKIDA